MNPLFRFLLISSFALVGCSERPKEEEALLKLFNKEKALNCQLASMKDSITAKWDNINRLMEENLPEEMPEEEKNNMLKVRNANLIRMFKSYDDMKDAVKMALRETEQMDEQMTKRITTLKKEVHTIETQKMILFDKIKRLGGAERVADFRNIYQTVLSQNCEEL